MRKYWFTALLVALVICICGGFCGVAGAQEVYKANCGGGGMGTPMMSPMMSPGSCGVSGSCGQMMQQPIQQPLSRPRLMTSVPPTIYQPRTVYDPYQYQGTIVRPKEYRTPVRDALFGRAVAEHIYVPVGQRQQSPAARSTFNTPAPSVSLSLTNTPDGKDRQLDLGNSLIFRQTIR